MTSHRYDPSELDRVDPSLDEVAGRLERYAAATPAVMSSDLAARIQAAVDAEPGPIISPWAAFLRGMRGPARLVAAAAVLVLAVLGALAVGELTDLVRPDVGSTPPPSVVLPATRPPSPSPEPSRSPSPTASQNASPSPSPSPSPTPRLTPAPTPTPRPALTPRPATPPATPAATASDDDLDTPKPSSSDDGSGDGG